MSEEEDAGRRVGEEGVGSARKNSWLGSDAARARAEGLGERRRSIRRAEARRWVEGGVLEVWVGVGVRGGAGGGVGEGQGEGERRRCEGVEGSVGIGVEVGEGARRDVELG